MEANSTTARLVADCILPGNITSIRKGGMQVMNKGNVLLAFGCEQALTEYTADGSKIWSVRLGLVVYDTDRETADNHRSFKLDWKGYPTWPPKIGPGPPFIKESVTVLNGLNVYDCFMNDTVYLSWNDATELSKWLVTTKTVSSGEFGTKLIDKTGFETGMLIGSQSCAQGLVFDQAGEVLGRKFILDLKQNVQVDNSDLQEESHRVQQNFTTSNYGG